MKKRIVGVGLAAVIASAGVVYAGARNALEVEIEVDATNQVTGAFGNIADAYNSADSTQYIGCGGTPTLAWCQAHDARPDDVGLSNAAFCMTQDPDIIAHIRGITQDSFVHFVVDPESGECTRISVSHQSFYRPKAHQ